MSWHVPRPSRPLRRMVLRQEMGGKHSWVGLIPTTLGWCMLIICAIKCVINYMCKLCKQKKWSARNSSCLASSTMSFRASLPHSEYSTPWKASEESVPRNQPWFKEKTKPWKRKIRGWITYPLVNIQKTMENQSCSMGKFTISMVIFHGYVKLPGGIIHYIPYKSL